MTRKHKSFRSFRYAFEGMLYSIRTQTNMKFHCIAAAVVLLLSIFFGVTSIEFLFLFLAICFVIMAELFNTAVEKTVDLAMPDSHPIAKIAKDVAAAAVLVTAVFAVVVALVIFYDKIFILFKTITIPIDIQLHHYIALITLVAVTLTVIYANWHPKQTRMYSNFLVAISFFISSLIALITRQAIPTALSFFLAMIVCLILYENRQRSLLPLLLGCFIGIGFAAVFYFITVFR